MHACFATGLIVSAHEGVDMVRIKATQHQCTAIIRSLLATCNACGYSALMVSAKEGVYMVRMTVKQQVLGAEHACRDQVSSSIAHLRSWTSAGCSSRSRLSSLMCFWATSYHQESTCIQQCCSQPVVVQHNTRRPNSHRSHPILCLKL